MVSVCQENCHHAVIRGVNHPMFPTSNSPPTLLSIHRDPGQIPPVAHPFDLRVHAIFHVGRYVSATQLLGTNAEQHQSKVEQLVNCTALVRGRVLASDTALVELDGRFGRVRGASLRVGKGGWGHGAAVDAKGSNQISSVSLPLVLTLNRW